MDLDLFNILFTVSPALGVMGLWVYSLNNKLKGKEDDYKDLQKDIKQFSNDYKDLTETSLKIITLADERLKENNDTGGKVREIHQAVNEIKELIHGSIYQKKQND